MKKITFLLGLFLITVMSFSQVYVKGISPATVQRNYEYSVQVNEGGWPGETDDGTWGMTLDFNIPGTYVQAELVLVNDGTPGTSPQGNPIAEEGCNPSPANAYAGKIAVVRRNTCNFAVKILEAQNAGAIAVVIVNREDALLGMLGIAPEGPQCTIPAVFLKSSDGNFLISEMQNGPVVLFIGSKVGVFNDDMGSSSADIVMPNELSVPSNIAVDGTNYPIDLGLFAFNFGNNPQTGVTASVDIVYEGGASVYNQTSAPLNFAAPAGFVLDTQYFDLGTFAPTTWNQGEYLITYTINLSGDEDVTDNVFSVPLRITNSVYAKARTTPGNEPIATTSYSLNTTTTTYDYWEPCIVFRSPVVATSTSGGGILQGMTFSATPINGVMTDEILELRAYQWNDAFTDMTGTVTFDALTEVGTGLYFFAGTPDSLDNIYVPFDSPLALLNDQRYLFCIYNAADMLRIGFDAQIDYTATINNYLQPIAPVSTKASSAAVTWYRDGFGWDVTPAISATIDFSTSDNSIAASVSAVPYPNPVVNMLNVPVRKGVKGNVTVEIFDLAGKLVISENKTIGEGSLKVNVASISNGAYLFSLTFADGSKDSFKVSVNR